jgi:hypothetical protein
VLGWGIAPSLAGVHLWRLKEAFSNADGTIQFIELATCCGSTTENAIGNKTVTSNGNTFTFPANVTGSTLNKHILLATLDFAALPGAPTPNHIIPANFFSTSGDTLAFSPYDTMIFTGAQLPTDGVTSLNKDPNDNTDTQFTATNSPTNYSGQTGSVVVVSGPPAVPDGTGGSTPLRVLPVAADGSALTLVFDTGLCTNADTHHVLYGEAAGLPATPGGAFTLLGGICAIGAASPYAWTAVPEATDGSGILWFIVVTTDAGGVEGSWGMDGTLAERHGPGADGSSGICATAKSVANACGRPTPPP